MFPVPFLALLIVIHTALTIATCVPRLEVYAAIYIKDDVLRKQREHLRLHVISIKLQYFVKLTVHIHSQCRVSISTVSEVFISLSQPFPSIGLGLHSVIGIQVY